MPTEVVRDVNVRSLFWSMVREGVQLGLGGGAALGAGYGACIVGLLAVVGLYDWISGSATSAPDAGSVFGVVVFSFFATAFGFVLGAFPGVLFGLLHGVVLGAITIRWFTPLTSQRVYRQVISTVGVLLTLLVVIICGLITYLKEASLVFVLYGIPSVVAIIWSFFASRRLAAWYIRTVTNDADEHDT